MLPHFLGIGAPRSGTRWMAQCLNEHPEVALPPGEVYFFTPRRLHWWKKPLSQDDYSDLFKNALRPSVRVWGEITPFYLYDDNTPEAIHKVVPDVKLICCLRDQSERVQSLYKLFLMANPDLFRTNFSIKNFLACAPEIIGREGFYLEHLQRYLGCFPREAILILLFDDLVTDPQSFIRQIFEFLGVDSSYVPPSVSKHINSTSEDLVFVKSLELRNLAFRLRKKKLTAFAHFIDRYNKLLVSPDKLPLWHMVSPKLRQDIADMFREHNNQLGQFLGRDLSHWNSGAKIANLRIDHPLMMGTIN